MTEYKVHACNYAHGVDKYVAAVTSDLNKLAKEGWKLVNATSMGSSSLQLLYLVRDTENSPR